MSDLIERHRRAVVIDIEAFAQHAEAAKIATIGAVLVDLISREKLGTFYVRCAHHQPGRVVEPSTAEFWERQRTESPEAYNEVYRTDDRVPLNKALQLLSEFIESGFGPDHRRNVFGNGPEYDNVILAHAYRQLELPQPWDYWCNQSMRTALLFSRLFLNVDPRRELPEPRVAHHALHDAEDEAMMLLSVADGFSFLANPEIATYLQSNK